MDEVIEDLRKYQAMQYAIGSSHIVVVTHINDPHSFYVRPISYDAKCLPVLEERGERLSIPTCGMIVIYKSKIIKKFVRGQVCGVKYLGNEPSYQLIAIDYGFSEDDVQSDIFKLKHNLNVGPLAIHCHLELCYPMGETFDNKAIEAMKFFIGNEPARMIVVGNRSDKLEVQLINSCPDDISKLLALTDYTNFGYVKNSVNRFACPPVPKLHFLHKKYNAGDILRVRVEEGVSLKEFFVSDVNDHKKQMAARNELTSYYHSQKCIEPEQMKVGLPVAVKLHFEFYERGTILDLSRPNGKAEVMLVDTGKRLEVTYEKLKLLKECFLLDTVAALYCTSDEKQISNNSLEKLLNPGFEFMVEIVTIGHEFSIPHKVNIKLLT